MSTGKWIRDNAALVIGILMPVIVVVFFLLASYIPRLLVDPPEYDFLFVQDYGYGSQKSHWRYQIDLDPNRRLRVRVFLDDPKSYSPLARLFRYEHASGNVREMSMPSPEVDELPEVGLIVEVAEFQDELIDSSRISPDGYEMLDSRRSGGDFLGVFYRGNRRGLALGKNGAVISIPGDEGLNWYSARFLGWIVTPSDQSPK